MVRILSKPSVERFTAALVALLSTASLIYAIIIGNRTNELAACQVIYANGFADALDARADAGQEPAALQDELWKIFKRGLASPSPQVRFDFEHTLDQYLAAREKVKATQAEHPIKAPRDLCPNQ
jgi:hypothetical protein